MPIQSGDSRYQHRLWFADPEAHAPTLMVPTTDLLAVPSSRAAGDSAGHGGGGGGGSGMTAGGRGGAGDAADGGAGGRGAVPADPLFPSLLVPSGTALGTVQMAPHPATAAALNHRLAWDRKSHAAAAAVGDDAALLSFNSFLSSRSRAVFRALSAPGPHNAPSGAGGVVGARPMFASVRATCGVLVGMGSNTSAATLASSGLNDAMFVRGYWTETGLPAAVQPAEF